MEEPGGHRAGTRPTANCGPRSTPRWFEVWERSKATDQFLCEEVDLFDSDVPELIAQVSRVSRLREVRALTGFTRVVPSTDENDVAVAPLVDSGRPTWLPAIEVLGEGVFLRLDERLLDTWVAAQFALGRTTTC